MLRHATSSIHLARFLKAHIDTKWICRFSDIQKKKTANKCQDRIVRLSIRWRHSFPKDPSHSGYSYRKYLIDINHSHDRNTPRMESETVPLYARRISTYLCRWHSKLWQDAACRKHYRGFVVICKIRAIIADDISRTRDCHPKNWDVKVQSVK